MKKKYATVDECGKPYREISKILKEDLGRKTNHTTVRHYVSKTMRKIAENLSKVYNRELTKEEINKLYLDPVFQECVGEILSEIKQKK